VLAHVGGQGRHVGLELGPTGGQLPQLDRGALLGVDPHGLGLLLGRRHPALGLLPGLGQRRVGGALGQHQGATHVVVAGLEHAALGPAGPLVGLPQLALQVLDAGGHLFEELVDLVRAVAPPLLAELDLTEALGRDVHGAGA
jgi:hypothetical protein